MFEFEHRTYFCVLMQRWFYPLKSFLSQNVKRIWQALSNHQYCCVGALQAMPLHIAFHLLNLSNSGHCGIAHPSGTFPWVHAVPHHPEFRDGSASGKTKGTKGG